MAVILRLLVEIHLYIVASAREVVAGQVHQHHMLGILLRIREQLLCETFVLGRIARTSGGTGYRVDARDSVLDFAVRLGRRAEDAESSEVEIEQIGRGVDAAKGAVDLEVIAPVRNHEPPREHDLEYVAAHAVPHSAPHEIHILLVGYGAVLLARSEKVVGCEVAVFDDADYVVGPRSFAVGEQFHERKLVLEMVEHQRMAVHDVIHVRRVVQFLAALCNRYVFQIPHGIEGSVSEKSAYAAVGAVHRKRRQEFQKSLFDAFGVGYGRAFRTRVGKPYGTLARIYGETGYRVDAYVGGRIFRSMKIGTLQQRRLRVEIAYFEIYANRSVQVAENAPARCPVLVRCHDSIPPYVLCKFLCPCPRGPTR